MVRAGLGVSVMPKWAIQPALTRGDVRAIRITPAGVHRQWSAVTLRDVREPPYLLDFLKLLPRVMGAAR
jgi:LysR family transcriptional regulator for metE and metH